MGDISRQMGYTVPSSDATPVWDTLATGPLRDSAVIVYPQATSPYGDLNRRTFWSIPFWRCSVGDCIDSAIDDVGYIEAIFNQLPSKANVDPKRVRPLGGAARARAGLPRPDP
jgi:poly(3-hydroxybutyrate) depolymerase